MSTEQSKILPTHRLRVLNKTNNRKATIGAGWQNEDGSISIVLDECTILEGRRSELCATLFPVERKPV